GLVAIGVGGMLYGSSARETSEGGTMTNRNSFHFWPSAASVSLSLICLFVAPPVATRILPSAGHLIARLRRDVLNPRDLTQQRRGYYEELGGDRMDMWHWRKAEDPEGWGEGKKVFYRERSDFLLTEVAHSISTVLGGAPTTSNRYGMRDREYEKSKPANVCRIVLLGSSHDQGTGVKDDE